MVAFCKKAMLSAVIAVRVWERASTRRVTWSLARVRDWGSRVARTSAASVGREKVEARRRTRRRSLVGVMAR